MEKKNGFGMIGIVLLLIAALILCAGCSNTGTSQGTGISPPTGRVLWEQKNIPTTDMEGKAVKISIKVTGPNYIEMIGNPVSSQYGLNPQGLLNFDVTLKNNGEGSVTITGARIMQNGEETSYNYAHYSDKERGFPTVTIVSGKTGKCSWLAASPIIGNTGYELVILATSSGGGESAKAQTGVAAKTPTPTSTQKVVQATATVGPTPTQVLNNYLEAVEQGDYNNLPVRDDGFPKGWSDRERQILAIQTQALKDGTFKITPIGPPEYGGEGPNTASVPVELISPGGVHESMAFFVFVDGKWLMDGIWRGS